ncbi:MAG TPA: Mov34/MPN/PAD-1 family protein [Candidatus Omnitrophota bacterium]|nr:Mov34/MPN/PAD-1 family protein [Candidatus Omnitrophota bacterium]
MYVITLKHFNTIVQHCLDYLPYEAGGFIGGRGNVILGIFPLNNFAGFEGKEKFEVSSYMSAAVYEYFSKNKIKVIGFYHSHPERSLPIPSRQDILTSQIMPNITLNMIVSIDKQLDVNVALYETVDSKPVKHVIKVVRDGSIDQYLL